MDMPGSELILGEPDLKHAPDGLFYVDVYPENNVGLTLVLACRLPAICHGSCSVKETTRCA